MACVVGASDSVRVRVSVMGVSVVVSDGVSGVLGTRDRLLGGGLGDGCALSYGGRVGCCCCCCCIWVKNCCICVWSWFAFVFPLAFGGI